MGKCAMKLGSGDIGERFGGKKNVFRGPKTLEMMKKVTTERMEMESVSVVVMVDIS